MKLLGAYKSNLTAFHYQELLQLYKTAITQGDFAGNATFNEAAIITLIQQSQDFSSLPLAAAGQRVTDDSLNNPLDLLTARYSALVSESNDFESKAIGLVEVLKKDTALLDQLVISSALQDWVDEQPELSPSTQFSWDYGVGDGPTSIAIPQEDPANGVTYLAECQTNTFIDVVDASEYTGLVAPDTRVTVPAKDMTWIWTPMTTGEQSEDLYGDGWAELNLLEDRPIINFLPNPEVQVILPSGGSIDNVFSIAGFVTGGSLPVYIRVQFVPRRNETVIVPQNAISNASFESGATGWTLGDGWSIQTGAGAHTGSNYASKAPFAAWNSGTAYVVGNLVSYLGIEYRCISNNTNKIPSTPGTTFWVTTGVLVSPSFPLAPLSRIYVESWIKNLTANGIFNVALSCRNHNDVEIGPQVTLPGDSSASDYLLISGILQAVNDPEVTSGRLVFTLFGQTSGTWSLDDVRVHLPQNLSAYVVNQDDVSLYTPKTDNDTPLTVYFQDQDFVVDDVSNMTILGLVDGTTYIARFTENYPAYQCSINEKAWSPVVMLDADRPYPDDETIFTPIRIGVDDSDNRTLFPITDEEGVPTGLTLQVLNRPLFAYYFEVTTPADPKYGATAVLQIDLSKPTYLNGLTISPFSGYPARLVKVELESFTSDTRQTVGLPNVLLLQPSILTFPTTLVRKVYLTVYQENYNLSEYIVQPPDSLRRDTLASLQTVLPFNVRRPSRAVPVYYRGAQYTFGFEDIAGINATAQLPGVFVAGPHHFKGIPEVIRFDASLFDQANFSSYLCWQAYDSAGVVLASDTVGSSLAPGQCEVFPFPSSSIPNRSSVDHVDIFMKFVLRSADVVLQRYLLQAANV